MPCSVLLLLEAFCVPRTLRWIRRAAEPAPDTTVHDPVSSLCVVITSLPNRPISPPPEAGVCQSCCTIFVLRCSYTHISAPHERPADHLISLHVWLLSSPPYQIASQKPDLGLLFGLCKSFLFFAVFATPIRRYDITTICLLARDQ